MSKEMKMENYFDLSQSIGFPASWSNGKCRAASHAIKSHDRLVEENTALREALRLKELECEALAGDKSELLLSLNETVHALADICGSNGIKGEDDFICEIEEFIVEMATNAKQTS